MRHVLEREQTVPRPRSEVFAFFADAANLERLTPSTLRFRVLTPAPIRMQKGTVIAYRLALFGIGFRWRSLIGAFEPEERFIDVQLEGPYHYWRHVHEFAEVAGGTQVRDRVEYEVPGGPLGSLARVLFVRGQLERIFAFRRETIARLFA